jgi:hypothetical protein
VSHSFATSLLKSTSREEHGASLLGDLSEFPVTQQGSSRTGNLFQPVVLNVTCRRRDSCALFNRPASSNVALGEHAVGNDELGTYTEEDFGRRQIGLPRRRSPQGTESIEMK